MIKRDLCSSFLVSWPNCQAKKKAPSHGFWLRNTPTHNSIKNKDVFKLFLHIKQTKSHFNLASFLKTWMAVFPTLLWLRESISLCYSDQESSKHKFLKCTLFDLRPVAENPPYPQISAANLLSKMLLMPLMWVQKNKIENDLEMYSLNFSFQRTWHIAVHYVFKLLKC